MLIADVSNVNGDVNFAAIKQAGVKAVWLKATEGLNFNDRDYQKFRRAANKAGLRVGAYHFAHPELHSAVAEAGHFSKVIGRPRRTDLRPVLDFETKANVNPEALEWWARRFNQVVKEEIGVVPIFYSYPAFIEEMRPSKPIGDGLWLASYGRNDGKDYPFSVPRPWKKIVAHQFTSNWHVSGHVGSIDLSYAPKLRAVLAHPVLGI